ncbi:MAG TPA: hypothetical protein VNA68_01320 [Candidatus Dormibacteraeota bacterium]|nr:hypothetical protein [Candidatus Dormibacteraeota bacterium]
MASEFPRLNDILPNSDKGKKSKRTKKAVSPEPVDLSYYDTRQQDAGEPVTQAKLKSKPKKPKKKGRIKKLLWRLFLTLLVLGLTAGIGGFIYFYYYYPV